MAYNYTIINYPIRAYNNLTLDDHTAYWRLNFGGGHNGYDVCFSKPTGMPLGWQNWPSVRRCCLTTAKLQEVTT